jgi:paired amphipathic helix protein Sin3a
VAVTDTSAVIPTLVPPEPIPMPPVSLISASTDDVQMIEKVRKHINNKTTYTEFIKLMNLYNQDLITANYALHRLQSFIGNNAEIMNWFKNLLGTDDTETVVVNTSRPTNTRISLSRCRSYGPSYRKLPRQETSQVCSGRDELCKAVLNDEWASHPTWDSEEAGFVAHKKTVFEETLHRIEEERHDYDSNIECLAQTISLVESIVKALETKTSEERRNYRTDNKLGGQSEFIWKRTIYKLYGREAGHNVIARMLDNTHVVAPHLLNRLRDTRERWKGAQRQWNEVWRQQTLQVYHKSLDHQGTNQRSTQDKRQFQPKTLQQEIKARYEDTKNVLDDQRRPRYQYTYQFDNKEVLMDALHLIFTQFEHKNAADDPQFAPRMKQFFATFLSMDLAQLRSSSEEPQSPASEQSQPSETAAPMRSKNSRKSKSLYLSVLDKDKNKAAASASASRDSTPVAGSMPEEEATSVAGAADEDNTMTGEAEPDTWFSIGKTGSKGDVSLEGSNDASEDSNIDVGRDADGGSAEKSIEAAAFEQVERTEFHMYCNSTLYCFMRLFGLLYERLVALYDYEKKVKALIDIQRIEKPGHKLFMVDRTPQDYFDDISESANYYRQLITKFEALVKGEASVTQSEIEDTLRRYYLDCGFRLYHLDKLLAQMDRQGLAMMSNDKEKLTEQLLKLWRQDRTKDKVTPHEEVTYQKQAMKYLAAKEKEGETASYRVTFVSTTISTRLLPPIY